MNRAYSMLSRRSLFAGAAAVSVAAVLPFRRREPSLKAQYFAALVRQGRMSPHQARAQLSRPCGPDWRNLPVSVTL